MELLSSIELHPLHVQIKIVFIEDVKFKYRLDLENKWMDQHGPTQTLSDLALDLDLIENWTKTRT